MPHIKNDKRYTQVKDMAIYAIMMPTGPEIYIGKCEYRHLRNHYRDHYNLHKAQTKQLIEAVKKEGQRPEMYLIEELEATEVEAYKHVVAWVKYFVENGRVSLNHTKTNAYADDLTPETSALYARIQYDSVEEYISDESRLFEDYGVKPARVNEDDDTIISFRVSEEEAERIKNMAEERGMTVSQLVRAAAQDGCVVDVSFKEIANYIAELRRQSVLIGYSISTIYQTGHYTPSDLALLQELADTVDRQRGEIMDDINKTVQQMRKQIAAARKK